MKFKLTNKRGSALILALVLTMVLFIMGIAFVSTSSIEYEMAENVNDSQYLSDAADYTVEHVKKVLTEDLFEKPEDSSTFLKGAASYDYPDKNNKWLASTTPEVGYDDAGVYYYWPQVTDLWETFASHTDYKTRNTGSYDDDFYLFNYYYDPDPYFRNAPVDQIWHGFYPVEAWDLYSPLSWRYKVNGESGISCRIITDDEGIYETYLNSVNIENYTSWNGRPETRQWDGSFNRSNAFSVFGLTSSIGIGLNNYNSYAEALGVYYSSASSTGYYTYSSDPVREADIREWDYDISGEYLNAGTPMSTRPGGARADADGDGVADSRWTRCYQVNADGDYMYAAVRIIDNCSMINLNTAFRRPGQMDDGTYYSSTDYTSLTVNDPSNTYDDWDGTSVSHIDAFEIVRDEDYVSGGNKVGTQSGTVDAMYALYYMMANSNVESVGIGLTNGTNPIAHPDYFYAINKSKCPYNPMYYQLSTSATYGFNAFPLTTDTDVYKFNSFDISNELSLRTHYSLLPSSLGAIENMWPTTLNVGQTYTNYNRRAPYDMSDNRGDALEYDYYEDNWIWFARNGMGLTGFPYEDTIYYDDSNGTSDQFDRRHMVTVFNKDRILRANCGYSFSDIASGLDFKDNGWLRCSLNVIENADNDGDGILDVYTDLDKDGTEDDRNYDSAIDDLDKREEVTTANTALAAYMGLGEVGDNDPATPDTEIQNRFGKNSTDRFLFNVGVGSVSASSEFFDYDQGSLAWQLALNMKDFQDYSSSGEDVACKKINNYPQDHYFQDVFGTENNEQLEKDTICISKLASVYKAPSATAGLAAGCYYAIEFVNPDANNSKQVTNDLTEYSFIFVNNKNEVICNLNLGDLNASGNTRLSGTANSRLRTLNSISATTYDQFVLCFYGKTYSGISKPVASGDFTNFDTDIRDNTKYGAIPALPLLTDLCSELSLSGTTSANDYIAIPDSYVDSLVPSKYLSCYGLFNLSEKIYITKRKVDGDGEVVYYPVDVVDLRAIEQAAIAVNGSYPTTTNFFANDSYYTGTDISYTNLAYRSETWWGQNNHILMPSFSTNAYGNITGGGSYNPWFCYAQKTYDSSYSSPIIPFSYTVSIGTNMSYVTSAYTNANTRYNGLLGQINVSWSPAIQATARAYSQLDISLAENVSFDTAVDYAVGTSTSPPVYDPADLKIKNISQLQEVFAVGARNIYVADVSTNSANIDVSEGKYFAACTTYTSLLRAAETLGTSEPAEFIARINLTDLKYQGLTDYFTYIDPAHDGIDNNGDGILDNEDWIAGRININTAPWYVIARLPWVSDELAQAIVAYRDKRAISGYVVDTADKVYTSEADYVPIVDYGSSLDETYGFPVDGVQANMEGTGSYMAGPNSAAVRDAWLNWVGWNSTSHSWDNSGYGPQHLDATRQMGMGRLLEGYDPDFNEDKGFKNVAELLFVTHDEDNKSGLGTEVDYKGNAYNSGQAQGAVKTYTLTNNAYEETSPYGVKYKPYYYDRADNRMVANYYNYMFDMRQYAKTYDINEDTGSTGQYLPEKNPNPVGVSYLDNPFYREDSTTNDEYERDIIFSRISNLVTTRSDVFTAYILVRLGTDGPQRRYIGIFDRSNVTSPEDQPRLVTLYQVPAAVVD